MKKKYKYDFGNPADFTRKKFSDKDLIEGWEKEGFLDILRKRKKKC